MLIMIHFVVLFTSVNALFQSVQKYHRLPQSVELGGNLVDMCLASIDLIHDTTLVKDSVTWNMCMYEKPEQK